VARVVGFPFLPSGWPLRRSVGRILDRAKRRLATLRTIYRSGSPAAMADRIGIGS